jgi:Predicted P-loop-containing kinase
VSWCAASRACGASIRCRAAAAPDGIAAEATPAGTATGRRRSCRRHDRTLGAPLRRVIETNFVAERSDRPPLRATLVSFGFKYGLPVDADLVVDVRFLPNPFWIPELRDLTGQDEPVRAYVLGQNGASTFLDQYTALLETIGAGYKREGKHFLTLAVGCTGGKHRSVTIAEELSRRLNAMDVRTSVVHRDLGRE